MSARRTSLQIFFCLAGFWVGLAGCSGNACRAPQSIKLGSYSRLKLTTIGTLPTSLSEVTFDSLEIRKGEALLGYQGPSGSGTVRLGFDTQ